MLMSSRNKQRWTKLQWHSPYKNEFFDGNVFLARPLCLICYSPVQPHMWSPLSSFESQALLMDVWWPFTEYVNKDSKLNQHATGLYM